MSNAKEENNISQKNINNIPLEHTTVHYVRDRDQKTIGFIAIHRGTKEHPAFGATRVYSYPTLRDASNDALRLAQFMSYKNALAGSLYGGGKGVLVMSKEEQADPIQRKEIFLQYVYEVNKLGGSFITGADVGVNMDDVRFLKQHSSYVVGLSRDPVLHTMRGVIAALKAALTVRFDNANIHDHSYSILGVGKVGWALLEYLHNEGARIAVADINAQVIAQVHLQYPDVEILSPENLLHKPVDVFIPCAMGGILNKESIENLPAKIIVGSANNQLSDSSIGDHLHNKGVLYVPDYVANGGGLISVINEYEQKSSEQLDKQVNDIEATVLSILELSKKENIPTHRIADRIAEERLSKLFPRK